MVFPVKIEKKQEYTPHHKHPVIFDINEGYGNNEWYCNQCGAHGPYDQKRWVCEECEFDSCQPCYDEGQKQIQGERITYQHEHPLIFNINHKYQGGWTCDVCGQGGYGQQERRWVCEKCGYDCCYKCIEGQQGEEEE